MQFFPYQSCDILDTGQKGKKKELYVSHNQSWFNSIIKVWEEWICSISLDQSRATFSCCGPDEIIMIR